MPSIDDIDRRMDMDLAIKEQLRSHNDNEDAVHILEHHFMATDRSVLEAVTRVGRMLGFAANEIKEGKTGSNAARLVDDMISRLLGRCHSGGRSRMRVAVTIASRPGNAATMSLRSSRFFSASTF